MQNIVKRAIKDLKPHPENEKIYGKSEDISRLINEIRNRGIVSTLLITNDNVIISGHSRWKACNKLVEEGDKRFEYVNCEIFETDNEIKITERLLIENFQRVKTKWQIANEAAKLLEIEKELASIRRKSTQNNNTAKEADVSNLTPQVSKGKARDIVAKKLGIKSGMEVDRQSKIVNKVKELEEKGQTDDAELIKDVIEKQSVSVTENLAKYIDVLTDEDKKSIRLGASVNSIVSKFKENNIVESHDTAIQQKESNNISGTSDKNSDMSVSSSLKSVKFESIIKRFNLLINKIDFDSIGDCIYELDEYVSKINEVAGKEVDELSEEDSPDYDSEIYDLAYDNSGKIEEIYQALMEVDDYFCRFNEALDEFCGLIDSYD